MAANETADRETLTIPIESLALLPELQTRAVLDAEAVDDYAALYGLVPCPLPPVVAFRLGLDRDDPIAVIDGFHRIAAAQQIGLKVIEFTVAGSGSLEEAKWAAAQSNAAHGVRRTNADKRRAVTLAITAEAHDDDSNRAIAKHTGVSYELVRRVRADLGGNGAPDGPPGADTNVTDRPDGDTASRDAAPAGGGFYQSAAKKLRRVHGQVCDLVGETDDLAAALADVVALANQYATAEHDAG